MGLSGLFQHNPPTADSDIVPERRHPRRSGDSRYSPLPPLEIFVLPVVIAATALGWGPSLLAVSTSVLAFDFFFTEPFYSFRIASPSDVWAAALLLVIAAIVSTIAAESRRRYGIYSQWNRARR